MKELDSALLKKFLKLASKQLEGEWLLLGGTLLPAVGIDVRTTVDIDLIGLGKEERSMQIELMDLAEQLGLSVESINQAAGFFLDKQGYDSADLVLLSKGKSCNIFRPSCGLYLSLKSNRISETDLIDSKQYFEFCKKAGDAIDSKNIKSDLNKKIKLCKDVEKRQRLKELRVFVSF